MRSLTGPDFTVALPKGWQDTTAQVRGHMEGREPVEAGAAHAFGAGALPTRIAFTRRSLGYTGAPPPLEVTVGSIAALMGGAEGGLRRLSVGGVEAITFSTISVEAFHANSRDAAVPGSGAAPPDADREYGVLPEGNVHLAATDRWPPLDPTGRRARSDHRGRS